MTRSACSAHRRDREQMRVIEDRQLWSKLPCTTKQEIVSDGCFRRVGSVMDDVRELVLIDEDIVVRRLARAKQSRVTIEVIVKLHWADDACVDYCAGGAIPATVGTIP